MPNPPVLRARTSTRSTRSAVRKPNLSRKKGPSLEEWDRVRPFIHRYYIEEGKKLKDILVLLSKEHELEAADHMLKERLKQWGYKKNFTKKEHKAAAEEAKRCADSGLTLPTCMEIDGRPYAWDRVYRHFGSDPQYKCSWLQSDVGWKAILSKICLKTSPPDHKIELVLGEVKNHWYTTLERAETLSSVRAKRKATTRAETDPREITLGFLTSLQLLREGHEALGRREMNNLCLDLEIALEQREPDLLKEIINIFTAKAWVRQPDIFVKVAKYVRNLSANSPSLGPCHPFTTILDVFAYLGQHMELLDTFAELALKVMMDLAEAGGDRVKLDRDYICAVETNYISRVQARLEWRDAKDLLERKFTHYRRTLGEHNHYTLSMQAALGRLYLDDAARARKAREKQNEGMSQREAEDIFVKLVKMGEKNPHDCSRNGIYISSAAALGELHFARQEFEKAQDYYCKALVWAADKFGRSHPYISVLLKEFRALQKLGELGLVEVKMEEKEDAQGAKGSPLQDCPDVEACGGAPEGQVDIDYSHESFAMFGEETLSPLAPDWLPALTNEAAQDVDDGNGAFPSEFLDSYMDTDSQEPWRENVQEDHAPSAWDFNAVATDVPQSLDAEPVYDGHVAVAPQNLLAFLQDDLPEFNFDMDDMNQLLALQ
ncbi:hypothetical protein, variant [Cladophialophora immunda]|uniref:Clr5 domain-containing protein n=1 Tax=Cladophialophora immunda TaxID=569365 RepID=A0A0D1ZB28_9EURO|nr:uncharacterized protein PV07_10593 [Cladophialophora immunda]XP_016245128.1 hypothetical protein, variant [Cladophialophora immunda]KIW24911.1 hypothetical protein PV07_10593 [Cladophialophora immunda]KIW24912.1 hypothetical protein, variant [Cladophialophora immunda]